MKYIICIIYNVSIINHNINLGNMDLQQIFQHRETIMTKKWNCITQNLICNTGAKTEIDKQNFDVKRCINGKSLDDIKYANGDTLLHIFARDKKPDVIEDLLKNGYEVRQDDFGFLPWHVAIAYGNTEVMEVFRNHGHPVFEKSEHFGFGCLHIAVLGRGKTDDQMGMVQYLLKNGADVNDRDVHDRTPIFTAAQYNKEVIAQYLLEQGADPLLETTFKYSTMSISASENPSLMMNLMDWYV